MPLKLYKRGEVHWLRGTIGGKRVHESTNTTDAKLADEWRIKRESELIRRDLYGAQGEATFAEAIVIYIEDGGSPRFLTPLLDLLGTRQLAAIDRDAINEAARKLYPNAAWSTINRQVITPISAVVSAGAEAGLCEPRAFKRRRPPRKASGALDRKAGVRQDWCEPGRASAIIAAAETDNGTRHIVPMLELVFGQGLRSGEMVSLDWRDVDLPGGQAWIWDTKTDDPRRVDLQPRVIAALEVLPSREGRVLRTNRGQPYVVRENGGGQFEAALTKACQIADVERITPHVGRHTWATWFYSATKDLVRLQEQGGWAKLEVLRRYVKLAPRGLTPALERHGWRFDAPDEQATNTGLRVVQ